MADREGVKTFSGGWMSVLATYRVGLFGDAEVVVGELRGDLKAEDDVVQQAFAGWDGPTYLASSDRGVEVALVRISPTRAPRPWLIHGLLLMATLFTTFMAGALLRGVDPLATEFVPFLGFWIPIPTALEWGKLTAGAPFAVTLMVILMAHEMGHFILAVRRQVPASLPYFIPFPPYFSAIGTLGAFIRMRGPLVRRSILLDIGVAGPIASFLPSLLLFALGLSLSSTGGLAPDGSLPMAVEFAGQTIGLGSSLVVHALLVWLFPGDLGFYTVVLHPVAFAAWVGLFITFLNLLPFGQLDGGHVLYALSGTAQKWAAIALLLVLLPLGVVWWGWWLWAGLAVLISRGRLAHPKVLQPQVDLDRMRMAIAWTAILIFFVTFVPVPIRL